MNVIPVLRAGLTSLLDVHGVYVQQCQLASSLAFKGIIRFPFLIHPILPVLRFPIIYLPPGLIDERRDEFLEILKNGFRLRKIHVQLGIVRPVPFYAKIDRPDQAAEQAK